MTCSDNVVTVARWGTERERRMGDVLHPSKSCLVVIEKGHNRQFRYVSLANITGVVRFALLVDCRLDQGEACTKVQQCSNKT